MGFYNANAIISFRKVVTLPQEMQTPDWQGFHLNYDQVRVQKTEAGYAPPLPFVVHVDLSVVFPIKGRARTLAKDHRTIKLGGKYDMMLLISSEEDFRNADILAVHTVHISDEENRFVPMYGGGVWRSGIDINLEEFGIEKPGKYQIAFMLREHEAPAEESWVMQSAAIIEFMTELPKRTNPCEVTVIC